MKSIKRIVLLLAFFQIIAPQQIRAQDGIPDPPVPPRLVNDFAGSLSSGEAENLEAKLVAFNDSTSTQIAVVIVPDLGDYDPSDYAQRLGQKWGVGGAKFNNGFVILVKPKTETEKGEAFIATGYGVEGTVPDATAWDIVNNEMIPRFRQNDYYGGINNAVEALFRFTSGEYTSDNYGKRKGKDESAGIIVAIILFVIAFLIFTRGKNNRNINRRSSNPVFWPFLFGTGSGGSWGSFTGGSGGFGGGGGGGFGGFGGGSFGGGGAGGSW